MKSWVKHTVGLLCHLPAAYVLFVLILFIWMLAHLGPAHGGSPHMPLGSLYLAHVLVTILLLAFFYLWLLIGSGFTLERKVLWAIGITFAAPVMMPVLYWLHLHRLPAGPYLFGAPLQRPRWPGRPRA